MRSLVQSYNVHTSFPVGLGTHYPIRSLDQHRIIEYYRMTRQDWNDYRLNFDSPMGLIIQNLLIAIYHSVLYHQESLVLYGGSSVYILPPANRIWKGPISILLTPFQIQLYIEKREYGGASIWGDFSTSHYPHPDDEEFHIEMALNKEI